MSYAVCPHCGETYNLFGEGNAEEMAANFNTQVLGNIPLDPELSRLSDAGEIESYETSEFEGVVEKVTESLAA
jgi:hypothetical protein